MSDTVPEPLDDELFPANDEDINPKYFADYDTQVAQIMQVNSVSKTKAEEQIEKHGRTWAHKRYDAYWSRD